MTMAERVRPDDQTLHQMLVRANSRLTPDGAEAWYRTDIPALVMEIQALRQEHDAAWRSFAKDLPDLSFGEHVGLEDIAEAWRAEASGLYVKANVQKLQKELSTLRYQLADCKADLQARVSELHESQADGQEKAEMLAQERTRYVRLAENAQAEQNVAKARITELERQLVQMDAKRTEAEQDGQAKATMAVAQVQEKQAQALEHLRQALELLA